MRAARTVIVAAGMALLAAACGDPTAPSTTRAARGVAYSACMRGHGVSKFPDPGADGQIPMVGLEALRVGVARFQAAQGACRHLLPNGGRAPDQARRQQARAQGLAFARCVRGHRVPSFPDPESTGRIPDPASVGIDQGSAAFRAVNQPCAQDRPSSIPSNSAYDAWLQTRTNGS